MSTQAKRLVSRAEVASNARSEHRSQTAGIGWKVVRFTKPEAVARFGSNRHLTAWQGIKWTTERTETRTALGSSLANLLPLDDRRASARYPCLVSFPWLIKRTSTACACKSLN